MIAPDPQLGYPSGNLIDQQDSLLAYQADSIPGLYSSAQTGTGIYNRPYPNSSDAKSRARDLRTNAYQELLNFEMGARDFFVARADTHLENMAFFANRHWNEQDIANIVKNNQMPYVIPAMRRFILTLLGQQRASRTEPRLTGRNKLADQYSEIYNSLLRYVYRKNRWDQQESDIYRDGVVGGVGVSHVENDPVDPMGNVKMQRVYPLQFMWDLFSATDARMQDAKYFWRGSHVTKELLQRMYPLWSDEISRLDYSLSSLPTGMLRVKEIPRVQKLASSLYGGTTYDPFFNSSSRQYVFSREFYRRMQSHKWRIRDGESNIIIDCDNQEQAVYEYRQLMEYYTNPQVAQMFGIEGQPIVSQPFEVWPDVVVREIWAADMLLDVQELPFNKIPYNLYIPELVDGEYTSYFEHTKPLSRFLDRTFIAMDKGFSGIQGQTFVDGTAFPGDWNEEQIRRQLSKPNAVLIIKNNTRKSMADIIQHVAAPQLGALPGVMMEMTGKTLEQAFGGQNVIGVAEGANESGIAVRSRQLAASQATVHLTDSFTAFQQETAFDTYECARHLDRGIQFEISREDEFGGEQTQIASLIKMGVPDIEAMEMDFEMEEVEASPTTRAAQTAQTNELIRHDPDLLKALLPEILQDTDMNAIRKANVIKQVNDQQQFENDLQTQDRALKKQEIEAGIEKMRMEIELRKLDLMIKASPPANVNVQLKPEASPGLMAEIMEKNGYQADPAGVALDQITHAGIQQAADDNRQEHFNKRLLPQQKESMGPKSGITGKPANPKDRIARKSKKPETV